LLAYAIATGAALVVLTAVFAPVSGAHFNPVVSLSAAARGTMPWREVPSFIAAQVTGTMAGVWLSHLMFKKPLLMLAQTPRTGSGQHLAEAIATFGWLLVIWASVRRRADAVAWLVGLYITAAYWFSSSTAFANPAVTLARCFSDTFAGIRPQDAPWFVLAQLLGAALSIPLIQWLFPGNSPPSPHT
jgi:glycerol uptake facilitator-like aquaporin